MGNKKTKHTLEMQTDKKIKGAILVLVILILCVAGYGISTMLPKETEKQAEADSQPDRRSHPSSSVIQREPLRKQKRMVRNAMKSVRLYLWIFRLRRPR